jgi:hypothetical protein
VQAANIVFFMAILTGKEVTGLINLTATGRCLNPENALEYLIHPGPESRRLQGAPLQEATLRQSGYWWAVMGSNHRPTD